jgi:nitroreductase
VNVYSAIQRRRTIRRFKNVSVPENTLIKLVDTARLAPSAGNIQPLEYITVTGKKKCDALFQRLKWAHHVKGGDTPPDDKKPAAYIIVLINRELLPKGGGHDVGAAVQNILLAALEEDISSCWLRSFDKNAVRALFNVPDHSEPDSVIALGKPAESPITEACRDSILYWRDGRSVMHVPKRKIDSILHRESY